MRVPTGSTDRYVYFVAVDPGDLQTRETGLTTFTVYGSRNGGAATAFTTPTVNETSSANMPGVYELLLDEQTTLTAGNDTEELCLHITQASMEPVTRVVELYRPETTEGNTLDVTSTGEAGLDFGNTVGTIDAAQIGADAITAAKIANGAIDAATFAAGAINNAAIAASAITATEAPNLDAAISSRATPAQVSTQVEDSLNVDTRTLPGQAAPTNTPTLVEAITWLYKAFRNKKNQTTTLWQLYDDAGTTVDSKATVSESGGTATKEEIISGP